jgi:hypothetical protein
MEVLIIAVSVLAYFGFGSIVDRGSPEVFLYSIGSMLYSSIVFFLACMVFCFVAVIKRQKVAASLMKLLVAAIVVLFPAALVPNFLPI